MTLIEWVSIRWRRAPVAELRIASEPVSRSTSRVPAEYLSLYTYLEHRYASNVVLTFEQMESLLGFPLPKPARTEQAWWTVPASRGAAWHSDAWTVARRIATPNLPAGTVAFERLP